MTICRGEADALLLLLFSIMHNKNFLALLIRLKTIAALTISDFMICLNLSARKTQFHYCALNLVYYLVYKTDQWEAPISVSVSNVSSQLAEHHGEDITVS